MMRPKAIRMLVVCTALWGVSFPTVKALALTQAALVPGASNWFLASLCVAYRFALSALILGVLARRSLPQLTRAEVKQGVILGLFGGGGILLQVHGLAYTSASTSAFLTQCYCLLIPLWVGLRHGRWPTLRVLLCGGLVVAGVAILSRLDPQDLRLGRGELETLLGSVLFVGQILGLEPPEFAQNNVRHFSMVMFAVMALMSFPLAVATTGQAGDLLAAYRTGAAVGLLAILIVACTLGGYLLMNRWQRHVTATEAGLIYCLEPVFASGLALFLPAWFSQWGAVDYPSETLTATLLIGGGLITMANVLVQWPTLTPNDPSPGPDHGERSR